MRKRLLLIGIVLIVLAVVLFFVDVGIASRTILPSSATYSLNPGQEVLVGTASQGSPLIVTYTDSINSPLEINESAQGILNITSTSGYYAVFYMPYNESGRLYLINNYTSPVTVSVISPSFSSLMDIAVLVFAAIVLGIIGIIIAILGAVLKPKAQTSV